MARQRAITPSAKTIRSFRSAVWRFFRDHRRPFPWRKTRDPYKILVSEVMLQQTQASRVVDKYNLFCVRFPTFKALAQARLSTVLRLWKGLGYNRRARALLDLARVVVSVHDGRLPENIEELRSLPGIGSYTAAAVRAFAFNRPGVVIETNIRAVFIHHFFPRQDTVHDHDLIPLIAATCSKTRSREWYSALMDYGAHLKSKHRGIGRRSRSHVIQSKFRGSFREFRAKVLDAVTAHGKITFSNLKARFEDCTYPLEEALESLSRDHLIVRRGATIAIPH